MELPPTVPSELLSLFGSTIFGGVIRLLSKAQDMRREERLLACHLDEARARILHSVRVYENKFFQWTRRVIALAAIGAVIILPKLVAIFCPDVPINIGYPQLSRGFLFFSADVEKIKWLTLNGLTITPLDTHLVAAITGLYFGGSIVGYRH
jgi:hypothetical protein